MVTAAPVELGKGESNGSSDMGLVYHHDHASQAHSLNFPSAVPLQMLRTMHAPSWEAIPKCIMQDGRM